MKCKLCAPFSFFCLCIRFSNEFNFVAPEGLLRATKEQKKGKKKISGTSRLLAEKPIPQPYFPLICSKKYA